VNHRSRLTALLAGALAGFCGGLFGVGGGLVMVPVLAGPMRLTQHQAHGTSLAVVAATALGAVIVYAIYGNVSWVTGVVLAVAGIVSAPWGARLATRLTAPALRSAFNVFLVIVGLRLLWSPPATSLQHDVVGLGRILIDLGIGLVAGAVAGFMGIGGGTLIVPGLTLLLGMPQQLAQGTSMVAIIGAGISGTVVHRRRGNVVASLVPWLAAGALAAGPLASWWVQRLPHALLARGFGAFLLLSAALGWARNRKTNR
jgi:uncharacterized membrane protein YfcA